MANTYNIPSLSAGAVTELLTNLYEAGYRNCSLDQIPSVNLVGSMGVGKSSAVQDIAHRLSLRLGVPVYVTDIRLLNFSPVDLRGVPTADTDRKFTIWLKPQIFDLAKDGLNNGHGGGDDGIVHSLYEYLNGEYTGCSISDIRTSVNNHLIVFAAEESRANGTVVDFEEFGRKLV